MVTEVNVKSAIPDSGRIALREAGCFEQYHNARGRIGSNTYIVVAARYESNAGVPLDKPTLFAALEKTIRTNAALSARLLPSPPAGPTWVRLPSVDLSKLVSFVDKGREELQAVLTTLFAQRIDFTEDLPMWKLLVLQDGTIAFAYDHTLGDGQSGLAFHQALLKALNATEEPPSGHSGIVTALPQDTVFTPSLEEAIDVSVPLLTVVKEVAQSVLPFLKPKHADAWTGNPIPTSFTMDLTVRIFNISPDDATRLINLSRQHKTTLTSTLHTLALIVLTRLIRARPGGEQYSTVPTSIPISLRRYTGAAPTALCNHVSAHQAHHPLIPRDRIVSPDTFPWDAAADLTETLRREAPHSAPKVGMLRYLNGQYEKYLLDKLGGKRSFGFELSNLGAFPSQGLGDTAKWRVRETLFAQADATLGAALKINTVGTPDGGLGVTVTWGKGAVDYELADEFVREFDQGLRGLIAS
ncbi:alcohol acetyltransferase [Fomes fomentarius]|nr:alcohol acetyltransferase [Fomes fomentarius]